MDSLYNLVLLGAVNDTGDLTASAMNSAPGMWLDPPVDSGNGFGAVVLRVRLRVLISFVVSLHILGR